MSDAGSCKALSISPLILWIETELDDLPVDYSILDRLRSRVDLAKEIEGAHHRLTKATSDTKWLQDTAKDMDIVLEDEAWVFNIFARFTSLISLRSEALESSGRAKRLANGKITHLKEQLQILLGQQLMVRGISKKYLTSGTVGQSRLVDDLVEESSEYSNCPVVMNDG